MRQTINVLGAAFLLGAGGEIAAVEPYDSVRTVTYEPYFLEDSWILLDRVNSLGVSVFVDVESPAGGASRYIGINTGEAVSVYNINAWDSAPHQFQIFLSNVVHEGAAERVIPIRMSSSEAAAALNVTADLIYMDCNDPDALEEKVMHWVTHLSGHGVLSGNRWDWPEVQQIVLDSAENFSLTPSMSGHYWFLSK